MSDELKMTIRSTTVVLGRRRATEAEVTYTVEPEGLVSEAFVSGFFGKVLVRTSMKWEDVDRLVRFTAAQRLRSRDRRGCSSSSRPRPHAKTV